MSFESYLFGYLKKKKSHIVLLGYLTMVSRILSVRKATFIILSAWVFSLEMCSNGIGLHFLSTHFNILFYHSSPFFLFFNWKSLFSVCRFFFFFFFWGIFLVVVYIIGDLEFIAKTGMKLCVLLTTGFIFLFFKKQSITEEF